MLIEPALSNPATLSFFNLVESHVLRALRTDHGIPVPSVRKAIEYAERELGIRRLLLSQDLLTDARDLFLKRYGQLIKLSASGQLAMEAVLVAHLKRVDWDQLRAPVRLHPFVTSDSPNVDRPIVIDATVAFGRPVLRNAGVSTAAIVQRLDSGETVGEIAADYDVDAADVEQAALYERAA